jgi:hypothetical protein
MPQASRFHYFDSQAAGMQYIDRAVRADVLGYPHSRCAFVGSFVPVKIRSRMPFLRLDAGPTSNQVMDRMAAFQRTTFAG